MKICSKCGIEKEEHDFYFMANSGVCRQCQSKINRFKRLMKKLNLDYKQPHLIAEEYIRIQKELDKHIDLNKKLYLALKNNK